MKLCSYWRSSRSYRTRAAEAAYGRGPGSADRVDELLDGCRLTAREVQLDATTQFTVSGQQNVADPGVIAQVQNARRRGRDIVRVLKESRIEMVCRDVPAIASARPDRHSDAKVNT